MRWNEDNETTLSQNHRGLRAPMSPAKAQDLPWLGDNSKSKSDG